MKGMIKQSRSFGAGAMIAVAGLLCGVGGTAQAATIELASSGAACRPVSAAAASSFYVANSYIWNTGSTNQYISCMLPDWNLLVGGDVTYLSFNWASSGTAGTVTCTVQAGGFYYGANQIASANTKSLTLAASSWGFMTFNTPLAMGTNYHNLNVSCNVPAGFKLGLIERQRSGPTTW